MKTEIISKAKAKENAVIERNIKEYIEKGGRIFHPRNAWGLPRGILKDEEKKLRRWAEKKGLEVKTLHAKFDSHKEMGPKGLSVNIQDATISDVRMVGDKKLVDLVMHHRKQNEGTVVVFGKTIVSGDEKHFEPRVCGVAKCHIGEHFDRRLGRVMAFIDAKNNHTKMEIKESIVKGRKIKAEKKASKMIEIDTMMEIQELSAKVEHYEKAHDSVKLYL